MHVGWTDFLGSILFFLLLLLPIRWEIGALTPDQGALLFTIWFGMALPDHVTWLCVIEELELLAWFALAPVWFTIEAALLALFGTTPAKWLFGIRVTHPDGTRLRFREAFSRCFWAWVMGRYCCLPFASLVAQIAACSSLMETGTTFWDKKSNAVVTHKHWGIAQATLCVLLAILAVLGRLALVLIPFYVIAAMAVAPGI